MSNYKAIRDVLTRISGQDNVFTVPRLYVEFTGDLTTAILLNQIVFLSDKSKRTDGFFYKTYKEWEEEVCLSKRQVSYSTKKLKEMDLIETKIKKANGSPTVHYKLDYDKLLLSLMTFCNYPSEQNVTMENNNMSLSLTEITTENTTEKVPYVEIIKYLNDAANKNYRSSTNKTKSLIKSRWDEGFRLDDFKKVIDVKNREWKNDPKMNKFIRPDTLFGTKFEGYLNQDEQTPQKVSHGKNNAIAEDTNKVDLGNVLGGWN